MPDSVLNTPLQVTRYYSMMTLLAAQKMKFSIKRDHIRSFLQIWSRDHIRSFLQVWSHLMKKSLMENFIFCAVTRSTNFNYTLHLEELIQDLKLDGTR